MDEQRKRDEEAAALVARGRAEQEAKDAEMAAEQRRLAEEMERQKAAKAAKEAARTAGSARTSDDFSYAFAEGMAAKVKAFRQRGSGGDTLFIKINHEANEVYLEEECKGMPSLEALAEKLEEEPIFVLHIHKVAHSDGRVQYPIAFMLYMPDHTPVHLKVMYTRPLPSLAEEFKVARHFVLADPDDLDEEMLLENLGITKK